MSTDIEYAQLANRVYARTQRNRTPLPSSWSELSDYVALKFGGQPMKSAWRRLLSCLVRVKFVALAPWPMLLLSGCNSATTSTWTEDVKLESGEMILIQRSAKLRANPIAGGGGGSFNEGMTLLISKPVKPDNPGPWSAKYVPILLGRDAATQEWAIVATFFHCDSWEALGRPKLPYTEYRYRQGVWVQQALSPQWVGRQANVLSSNRRNEPHVTLPGKAAVLSIPTIAPEYKRVVEKWDTTC